MKKIITLQILFILFSIQSKAQTGLYVPQLAAFDAAMTNLLSTYNIPGGQLAITYKGRLVYNRGFGFSNTSTLDSVQPNSIFRVASISKTVTGVAVMKLYEQGLINLDAKVFGASGILNDAIYQNILDPQVNNITVRNLLQHSGGWNSAVSGDPMFDAYNIATVMGTTPPANPSVVVQYILSHKMLDFAPNTQYQYSNFGFCVLGLVIEKITGQSYDAYVKYNVLSAAGITDMELAFNLQSNKLPNEVNYYDYPSAPLAYSVYNNFSLVPWPYAGFNIEAMDAHGGWVASAADLCKFMVAIDKYVSKPDILLPSTIDTLIKPSLNNINYGCGINVNANNNWWHLGSIPGTTTEFVVNRNQQLNWAILCNSRDNGGLTSTAVDNLVWNNLSAISSWPTFDLFTGVDEIENNFTFGIYPNPSSKIAEVKCQTSINKKTNLRIFDVIGEEVFHTTGNSNLITIDVSKFKNGIYFIQLEINNKLATQKLLVQH